jgi:hypothetical protein
MGILIVLVRIQEGLDGVNPAFFRILAEILRDGFLALPILSILRAAFPSFML